MAYNASNEERTQLLDIKKNERGEHIIVTKIRNKANGNESIDIRQFYTNDESQVLPTQKGIRLNTENLVDLIFALTDALEANELFDLQDRLEEKLADEDDDTDADGEMTGLNDDMPPMD